MSLCPCGSTQDYLACCGLYISGQQIPRTAEALMRSRYTAYTMANIDYIKKTMRGKPLLHFNSVEAANWAKSVHWLGLKIIKTDCDPKKRAGLVEFIATYINKNTICTLHEISQFRYIDNCWFYTDGEQINAAAQKQ